MLPNEQNINSNALYNAREKARKCEQLTNEWCNRLLNALPPHERREFDFMLSSCVRQSGFSYHEWVKAYVVIVWQNLTSGTPEHRRNGFNPELVLERIKKKGTARGTLLKKEIIKHSAHV